MRTLIILALLMFPVSAMAQEEDTPAVDLSVPSDVDMIMPLMPFPDTPRFRIDDEVQLWVDTTIGVPFDGVLMNPPSIALILTEYKAQRGRGIATLQKQRASDFAVYQLHTGRLKVELASVKKKSDIRQQASDGENKRLVSINKDLRDDRSGFWDDVLKIGGALGVGLLLGLVLGGGGG